MMPMRKRIVAAAVVAAAILVPATVLAAQPAVPAGSLWNVGAGAAPVCRTVTAPPEAPGGVAPILTGEPGHSDQWCWAYARIGAGGVVTLPGGVPGERLAPAAYAAQTGSTVTVVYQPGGGVIVYLSS